MDARFSPSGSPTDLGDLPWRPGEWERISTFGSGTLPDSSAPRVIDVPVDAPVIPPGAAPQLYAVDAYVLVEPAEAPGIGGGDVSLDLALLDGDGVVRGSVAPGVAVNVGTGGGRAPWMLPLAGHVQIAPDVAIAEVRVTLTSTVDDLAGYDLTPLGSRIRLTRLD